MRFIIILISFLMISSCSPNTNYMGKNAVKKYFIETEQKCKLTKKTDIFSHFIRVNDTLWALKYEVSNAWYKKYFSEKYYDVITTPLLPFEPERHSKYIKDSIFPLRSEFLFESIKDTLYFLADVYDEMPLIVNNVKRSVIDDYLKWLNVQLFSSDFFRTKLERDSSYIIRLPTTKEWEYIASRGSPFLNLLGWDGNWYFDQYLYPKGNFFNAYQQLGILKRSKAINKSYFKRKKYRFPSFSEYSTIYDLTCICSFEPNSWGFYNLSGNVSELVFEMNIAKGGSITDPPTDNRENLQIVKNSYYGIRPVIVKQHTK